MCSRNAIEANQIICLHIKRGTKVCVRMSDCMGQMSFCSTSATNDDADDDGVRSVRTVID